jgi:hypothetical protein
MMVVVPVHLGDSIIYVTNLTNLIVGDTICNNGNCQQITAFYIAQQTPSKRASPVYAIQLSGPIGEVPRGGTVTAVLDPNANGRNTAPVLQDLPMPPVSSASTIIYSVAILALIALF